MKRKLGALLLLVFVFTLVFSTVANMESAEAGPAGCDCKKWCPIYQMEVFAKRWPPTMYCDFDPVNCFDCPAQ